MTPQPVPVPNAQLLLIEKDFVDTKHRRAEEEALLHTNSDQGRPGWDQLKGELLALLDCAAHDAAPR